MKLSKAQSYLVLQGTADSKATLRVYNAFEDVLRGWNSRTRVSPIYGLSDCSAFSPDSEIFSGKHYVSFIGLVRPFEVLAWLNDLTSPVSVWLTLGSFNIVCITKSEGDSQRIRERATAAAVRWETWVITDGLVSPDTLISPEVRGNGAWRDNLADLPVPPHPPEFSHVIDEYRALMASALARAENVSSLFYADLTVVNEMVLEKLRINRPEDQLGTVAMLIDLNAALSRFASQALSGSSPIKETECHFWTHSLLGTGVANLAFFNIRQFLQNTLGEARIPERVAAFANIQQALPKLGQAEFSDPIWRKAWIDSVKPDEPLARLFPQVAYLSGRDGFRTTETTLSAPLSTITSCSSLRWSLLTITHEMTHTIIGGVLAVVLPDFRDPTEVERTLTLLNRVGQAMPTNLLEELRYFLLRVMHEIDQADGMGSQVMSKERLVELIRRRKEEVEEIMVHTFDFIYFYGRKPAEYISGIWHSWNSIPHLHPKIEQYVIRTICAVLANYIDRPNSLELAKADVVACFENFTASASDQSYVNAALDHLNRDWAKIEQRLSARKSLVAIILGFLHSPAMLQAVRGQAGVAGGRPSPFTPLELCSDRIENPLRFIEEFTSVEAEVPKSVWMLQTMSFNCFGND